MTTTRIVPIVWVTALLLLLHPSTAFLPATTTSPAVVRKVSESQLFSSAASKKNNYNHEKKLTKHDDAMAFMEQPAGNTVGDSPDLTLDKKMVQAIAKAADARKAEDIVALEVAHVTTLTSYMMFLSGNSKPQNQAIAAAIADDMEEFFGRTENPQGTADSGWMVLDYGGIMVHIMTPKSRLYYNVEGQWRDKGGEDMDLDNVLVPNNAPDDVAGGTMEGLTMEDDPFWS